MTSTATSTCSINVQVVIVMIVMIVMVIVKGLNSTDTSTSTGSLLRHADMAFQFVVFVLCVLFCCVVLLQWYFVPWWESGSIRRSLLHVQCTATESESDINNQLLNDA